LTLLGIALCAPAHAAPRTCAGVTLSPSKVVAGKKLVLNGAGLREATFLNVDVFVATLYVERRSRDAKQLLTWDQHVQVELHFVRDTDASTIVSELDDGLDANAPTADAAHKRTLLGWIEDMAVGDSMIFTYVPKTGLEVRIRGKIKGTIASRDFAAAVLSILIGPKPIDTGLRAGLLGGPCD
jgi:hypothetical protein